MTIWFALALILPSFFVATIIAIPKPQSDPQFRSFQSEALSTVLFTAHSDQFIIKLRTDGPAQAKQIEVILIKSVSVPEALVYLSCGQSEKILLGKLSSKETHRFPLDTLKSFDNCEIEFFDPFNNIVFDKISL